MSEEVHGGGDQGRRPRRRPKMEATVNAKKKREEKMTNIFTLLDYQNELEKSGGK